MPHSYRQLCLSKIYLNKLFVRYFLPIIVIKAVEGKIETCNAVGAVVKSALVKNTNFTIDLSDLTSDVYTLKHFDENSISENKLVITK